MFGILLLILLAVFYAGSGGSAPPYPPPYAPPEKEEKGLRTIIIVIVVVVILVILIPIILGVYFFWRAGQEIGGIFEEIGKGYAVDVSILDKCYTHCIKGDYGWDNETPANGSVFFIVDVKVKNTGTKDVYVSQLGFTLSDTTGRSYSTKYSLELNNSLEGATVYPGDHNSGKICFEILETSTPKTLRFEYLWAVSNTTTTGNIPHVDYVE
ncbi:MAG: DUF4352 domain-containing protein [Candidatus Thermoplasmatota archaeon]